MTWVATTVFSKVGPTKDITMESIKNFNHYTCGTVQIRGETLGGKKNMDFNSVFQL